MRLRLASDLHFEFQADHGRTLVADLQQGAFDVLVVAGDLTNAAGLGPALTLLAESFSCPIVYVHGNHEFYGSNRQAVINTTRAVAEQHPHIRWLDNGVVTIGERRFLGTPLWFREKKAAPEWAMGDFTHIAGFRSWVYEENRKAREFLREKLRHGDIVVTHHLPTQKSIHPKYRGDALNTFFLCDMSALIDERLPAAWLHGHTHSSCRYTWSLTEVHCNPFGYAGTQDLNREFRSDYDVEV